MKLAFAAALKRWKCGLFVLVFVATQPWSQREDSLILSKRKAKKKKLVGVKTLAFAFRTVDIALWSQKIGLSHMASSNLAMKDSLCNFICNNICPRSGHRRRGKRRRLFISGPLTRREGKGLSTLPHMCQETNTFPNVCVDY